MKDYKPIPFKEWKSANPDLCPDEKCDACSGDGKYDEDCECPECGNDHLAHDVKCNSCGGTGVCEQGGKAAYLARVKLDRERWEERRYLAEGPVEVFVFGSNRQGIHGAGAAKRAVQKYGAVRGQPEGRQGRAYAIVTKELRPGYPPVVFEEVARGVLKFLDYARKQPRERFLVTKVGGGLAGFDWERQVRPLFDGRPENVVLLEGRQA